MRGEVSCPDIPLDLRPRSRTDASAAVLLVPASDELITGRGMDIVRDAGAAITMVLPA
jgi:hypothetical protein